MNETSPRIVCVGEVMIEMTRTGDGRFAMSCGGDTFNTAVYLAREGIAASYATALGDDDPYSNSILSMAAAEHVGSEAILRVSGRLPGLYLIETDDSGERTFHYWRDSAPARELFDLPDWGKVAEHLLGAKMIYFSGITLSLYSNLGLGRFLAVVEMARAQGARIVFDANFRPRAWKGDLARTRTVFMEALKRVDIALPTFDDEALLWGDPSPEATIERLQAFGIGEVAVKNGPNSAVVSAGGKPEFVPVTEVVVPIDTTAAGDSFNAAYLAARLNGEPPNAAAAKGHLLAGQVVQHRGAIMPRAARAH